MKFELPPSIIPVEEALGAADEPLPLIIMLEDESWAIESAAIPARVRDVAVYFMVAC